MAAPGPIPLTLPVGNIPGFGPSPTVSAWLFLPPALDPAEPQTVAFCIHGGGYSKRYFHIDEGAVQGYSMARHFAERGVVAVAIDCLGSGESSRAEAARHIVSENLALAHHNAARHLLAGLESGNMAPNVPAMPRLSACGVGHSLGGMLLVVQQSRYKTFGRIVVLGWSNLGINLPPEALMPTLDETGTYAFGSAKLRQEFHLADVPAAALATTAERENLAVSLSLGAQSADRPSVRAAAGEIDVPVFLGFGEKDTSRTAHDEPSAYTGSKDITLFVLEGSAHCHNFAGTRTRLWDKILEWAVG